jgi:Protein of unknown function (DUF2847).
MCDSVFHPLTSQSDWSDAKAKSSDSPVLLFKHTLECPVSETAAQELRRLARSEDVAIYRLVVQDTAPWQATLPVLWESTMRRPRPYSCMMTRPSLKPPTSISRPTRFERYFGICPPVDRTFPLLS